MYTLYTYMFQWILSSQTLSFYNFYVGFTSNYPVTNLLNSIKVCYLMNRLILTLASIYNYILLDILHNTLLYFRLIWHTILNIFWIFPLSHTSTIKICGYDRRPLNPPLLFQQPTRTLRFILAPGIPLDQSSPILIYFMKSDL